MEMTKEVFEEKFKSMLNSAVQVKDGQLQFGKQIPTIDILSLLVGLTPTKTMELIVEYGLTELKEKMDVLQRQMALEQAKSSNKGQEAYFAQFGLNEDNGQIKPATIHIVNDLTSAFVIERVLEMVDNKTISRKNVLKLKADIQSKLKQDQEEILKKTKTQ